MVGIDDIVRVSVELVQYDRNQTKILYLHTYVHIIYVQVKESTPEDSQRVSVLTLRLLKDNFWTLMASVSSEAVKLTSKS